MDHLNLRQIGIDSGWTEIAQRAFVELKRRLFPRNTSPKNIEQQKMKAIVFLFFFFPLRFILPN